MHSPSITHFVRATALTWLSITACAQQVVDYDTSTLASPPAFGYPLYTPGAGSLGRTVRVQFLCPDSYLGTQGLAVGFVTHIGLSLAGQATYDTFQLRAGISPSNTLTNVWDTNLPDQRVQRDLGNVSLQGGGTTSSPTNQWVEFELDYPFYYQPGQSIVVDLTTHVATSGIICGTTVGTGIARAYSSDYLGAPVASTVQTTGGLVFRMRFQPPTLVPFGAGCPGTGNFVPQLSSSGQSALGSTNYQLQVTQALPGAFGGFLLGFSRNQFVGGSLPYSFGAGCDQWTSAETVVGTIPTGGGLGTGSASMPFTVPNWPSLLGTVLYAQFAQLDASSAANLPVVFSNAGAIVLY